MDKKKTTDERLDEIITLLTPIANLAKFNITQINQQLEAQKVATEARTSDDANKDIGNE